MTAIVGILCRDGIVIGTDSSATFSAGTFRTIEQQTEKISVIADRLLVACTGAVGLAQRFCAVVDEAWSESFFSVNQNRPEKWHHICIAKELFRRTRDDFNSTGVGMRGFGALVAFPCQDHFYLCEFQLTDFQPEFKTPDLWYVSLGSAQPITDPFLAFMREVFWEKGPPSVHDGVFAATWTLDHAVAVNPGGVNAPIRIAVLEKGDKAHLNARLLEDDQLNQHRQNVEEAKEHLRQFPAKHRPENAPAVPEPPKFSRGKESP